MSRKSTQQRGKPEADTMLLELAEGASKVLNNATDLFREASALYGSGSYCRAVFLHQISLEECAKIEMLGALAVSMLAGQEPTFEKLKAAFASHKAKNYLNAYGLPPTKAESDARRDKRWSDASKAFAQKQVAFHSESNTTKNASLYVDLQGGTFVAPIERIDEAMVVRIADANAEILRGVQLKVAMLNHWVKDPIQVRDMVTWFYARMGELKSQSDDPEKVLSVIMREMLTRAKRSDTAKH